MFDGFSGVKRSGTQRSGAEPREAKRNPEKRSGTQRSGAEPREAKRSITRPDGSYCKQYKEPDWLML